MLDIKAQIDLNNLPVHIAIIMDGNGRWAKQRGMPRLYGHKHGVKSVRETTEACAELGLKYLTLYAFSTENWKRPAFEVNALMSLLVETLHKEIHTMNDNNIKLRAIGELTNLPEKTYKALMEGIENTRQNSRMTLILALNYSAKWEILKAAKMLAADLRNGIIKEHEISESIFNNYLVTRDFPDPELLIRTSGEQRISNFLLWQIAYTELYFTDVFWPDFRKENLYKAIVEFQNRERRFGKISEQLV